MSRSLTRAVVLNKKKLDYAPRSPLSWSPLESSVSSVKYFDETSASSAGGEDEVARRCQGAEIVIIKEMPFGAGVISALPRSVSMIIEAGTGYNNIDCSAARSRGISVCNVPDYSSDAVATMVMTAVLNFSSGMFQLQRSLSGPGREEGIEKFREEGGYQWPLFELLGKRIGLVGGSGTIGRKVTSMALPFGMNVAVTSRTGTARSGQTCVPLDEMLATSDFVSLHCPLNDETEGMMGKAQFKKMKKGSYLINTARGGVVNQPELVDFLNGGGGGVEGAFLDVQGEFLFVINFHFSFSCLAKKDHVAHVNFFRVAFRLKVPPSRLTPPTPFGTARKSSCRRTWGGKGQSQGRGSSKLSRTTLGTSRRGGSRMLTLLTENTFFWTCLIR